MAVGNIYIPIGYEDDCPASTSFFMMNNLLYSRLDSGYPSNDEYFDEDVNVYLANLLESLIHPEYHCNLKKYLAPCDLSLFDSICKSDDPRTKYITYRINADFILVSTGIFNNPRGARPNSVSHMGMSNESWLGRGKAYYHMAQSYALQAYHRSTAISDIMGKLAAGMEKYARVLSVMKSEYLNIYERISDGEIYHLQRAMPAEEAKKKLASLHDRFLDAYSEFRENRSDRSREDLEEISMQIRKIDPSFSFSIKEET